MASPRKWLVPILVIGAVAAFIAMGGWRLLDLYVGPWESYQGPARAFLTAAADRDSSRLARLGASPIAISRVLAATRAERLAPRGRLQVGASQQIGDTTRLTYVSECPVVMSFVGSAFRARVVDFVFLCSDP